MELLAVSQNNLIDEVVETPSTSSFIEANTLASSAEEIRSRHIIPVFSKDNEVTLSHTEFIDTTYHVAREYFQGVKLLQPQIRVSHPIKGRVPDARNKAAKELQENEKTLYYERMAFMIELPEISCDVNGNKLSLVVGGVKAYSEDNLYNKKGSAEHFKIFIGFQNKVCLNLCIWTDGLKADVRVTNTSDLSLAIYNLIHNFQAERQIDILQEFSMLVITEHQFAQLIGRAKLYQFLQPEEKKLIPSFLFGDYHINTIARDYYGSQSFGRDRNGNINLWNLYNLFTGANKSSYIDKYLERGLNATQFTASLTNAIKNQEDFWFIN